MIKQNKIKIANGCSRAVFGRAPVLNDETTLLSTIRANPINAVSEPDIAKTNGRTLERNKITIMNSVPNIEPKARHSDF